MERPGDPGPRAAPSNPLLSTAVTGLRLQDLTHHAVLLPVLTPDSQNARPQNAPSRTVGPPVPPRSSDDNANKLPPSKPYTESKPSTAPTAIQSCNAADRPTAESKAPAKSEDDFDVNEYFARLQGTRYVSAPLNIREDGNANMQEAEENLEEVDLLEDSGSPDARQSLTADIAQNFSQLPQVLPQVASAVFSSFSSILSLKSRGETPVPEVQYGQGDYGSGADGRGQVRQDLEGYSSVASAVPMFTAGSVSAFGNPPGVGEDGSTVVGPPPLGGATNTFRMTNKKKTYAHIPGLSSGETHIAPQMAPPSFKPAASDNILAAPQSYAATSSTSSFGLPIDSKADVPTKPVFDSGDDEKTKSEEAPASSAVMTGIMGTQLTNISSSSVRGWALDENTSRVHVDFGSDVNDFSGKMLIASINDQALLQKDTGKNNADLEFFVPPGIIDDSESALTSRPSTSDSFLQTGNENLPPATSLPAFNLQSSIMVSASAEILPPPPFGNLPPRGSVHSTGVLPTYLPSHTILPPPMDTEKPTLGGSPFETVLTGNLPPTIRALPTSGNISLHAMIPPPIETGKSNFSEPLIENAPSENLYATKPFPPIAGLPPPTRSLPPSVGRIPQRNTSVKTAFIPPSLAREHSSKQTFSTGLNPIGPELGILAPDVHVPQIFTPTCNVAYSPLHISGTTEPVNFFNPTSIVESSAADIKFEIKTPLENIYNSAANVDTATPKFFNPLGYEQNTCSVNKVPSSSSQILSNVPVHSIPEDSKLRTPLVEPPKIAADGQKFRLGNKKRLQYYSGPIDTSGPIGNTAKPASAVFPSMENVPSNISLFTPDLKPDSAEVVPGAKPFDAGQTPGFPVAQTNFPYDIGQPLRQEPYATPFDLSRPNIQENAACTGYLTGEPNFGEPEYDQEVQKDEFKPAALLGSLKSKLSSVNINKLQSAVTSFFDPAYYEAGKNANSNDNNTKNFSYGTQPSNVVNFNYGPIHGPDSHSFEISVPQVNLPQYQQRDAQIQQQYQHPSAQQYQPFDLPIKQQHYQNPNQQTPYPYQLSAMSCNYSSKLEIHPHQCSTRQEDSQQNSSESNIIHTIPQAPPNNEGLYFAGPKDDQTYDRNIQGQETENILSYFSNKQETYGSLYIQNQTECTNTANVFKNEPIESEEKKELSDDPTIKQDSSFAYLNPFEQLNINTDSTKPERDSKIASNYFLEQNSADFFGPASHSPLVIGCSTVTETGTKTVLKDHELIQSNVDENRYGDYKNDEIGDRNTGAITTQLIENMTSPIQLFNPVEVPFTESSNEACQYDININTEQFDEISQITEETIETIQIQSSIEFLEKDSETNNVNNQESNMFFDEAYGSYGWSIKPEQAKIELDSKDLEDDECNFPRNLQEMDSNDESFNIPRNASDEIKAELIHVSQEDVLPLEDKLSYNLLPRQMSVPTAPPMEFLSDLEHIDEKGIDIRAGVLDINLIEQDAKGDFLDFDSNIIEPSETDDDKLESFKDSKNVERNENEDFFDGLEKNVHVTNVKTTEASPISENFQKITSPPVTFASYFDTGNYAAENYFRNVHVMQNLSKGVDVSESTLQHIVQSSEVIHSPKQKHNHEIDIGQHLNVTPSRNIKTAIIRVSDISDKQLSKRHITENPDNLERKPGHKYEAFFDSNDSVLKHAIEKTYHETRNAFAASHNYSFDQEIPVNQPSSDSINNLLFKDTFEVVQQEFDKKGTHESSLAAKHPKTTAAPPMVDTRSALHASTSKATSDLESSVNLLASYFTDPPLNAKAHEPDPQKSFFELSEGQDHYMHQMQACTIPEFGNFRIDPAPNKSLDLQHQNEKDFLENPFRNTSFCDQKNVFEQDQSQTLKSVIDQSQEKNNVLDTKTTLNIKEKFEISPHSADQTHLESKHYLINKTQNIPNEQPQLINTYYPTKIPLKCSNKYKNDPNKIISERETCAESINKAECNPTIPKVSDKTVADKNQFEREISFSSDVNYGGEIEELFTDYESRLEAIINSCEHCRVGQVISRSVVKGSGVVVSRDFRDPDSVCDGEVMEADGMETGKKGEVNMMTETASTGRGMRASVTFADDDKEHDEWDGSELKNHVEAGQYREVRHHWFYRLDREGKSVWKPFSTRDSDALEEAFKCPELNERTLVATDGGRYDVSVVGRIRTAVYWSEKPTNVRRCSWFYKGTTDSKFVPYTEAVADLLEVEYRRGCETGAWHRRVPLPAGESVVLHGADVMVHFLQGAGPDAWGNATELLFSKRVYRGLPGKIKLRCCESDRIDHLLLMVHGVGCHQNTLVQQSVMRPRVVHRGPDESEIEDGEQSVVEHLLLLCHGIGSACDLRFRPIEDVVDDFRATSLQLMQSHYRSSCESGKVGRIEVLPVSWHSTLHSGETGVDARLAAVTLDSIPRLRGFTNDTVLDVLLYTSPVYCQTIMDTVGKEMNRIYELFVRRNPGYRGGVSLGGHSLGSLILFDLLCHQRPSSPTQEESSAPTAPPGVAASAKRHVKSMVGSAGTGQPYIIYPQLDFEPRALYALGSPIAIFECIRGVESLGEQFALPTCPKFFNIFHPYDPIAYRIEPLINAELKELPPLLIPHHKGRKRMHLELKETMARVGADIRQRLVESLRSTWATVWRAPPLPASGTTGEVSHDGLEKEEEEEDPCGADGHAEAAAAATDPRLGRLNGGRRVDHVLQEAPFEIFNEYLFAMSSHVCYWESEDTMLLILREVYGERGVAADRRVPQQTMSVEVQRAPPPDSPQDLPSTSR